MQTGLQATLNQLARDYVGGIRYAYGPKKLDKDTWLHRSALVSVLALGASVIIFGQAVVGPGRLERLVSAVVALLIGIASAAWVVHRYRRRAYPPPDALATAVHVVLDKADEVKRRRRGNRT